MKENASRYFSIISRCFFREFTPSFDVSQDVTGTSLFFSFPPPAGEFLENKNKRFSLLSATNRIYFFFFSEKTITNGWFFGRDLFFSHRFCRHRTRFLKGFLAPEISFGEFFWLQEFFSRIFDWKKNFLDRIFHTRNFFGELWL